MDKNKRAASFIDFHALWPTYMIIVSMGLFVLIVGCLWIVSHAGNRTPLDDTAWIVLGATLLRLATVVIATASLYHLRTSWLRHFIFASLWAAASAQLIYPLTETVIKLLALTDIITLPSSGLGNMTSTGWFNFAATWLIFGVPGVLFALAAISYGNRNKLTRHYVWLYLLAGSGILFLIGLLTSS